MAPSTRLRPPPRRETRAAPISSKRGKSSAGGWARFRKLALRQPAGIGPPGLPLSPAPRPSVPAAFATRCVRPPRRLITKVYLDGSPSKLWLALPHVHTVGPGAETEAKRGLRAMVGGAQRQGAQTVFLLPTPGVCEAEVHEQDFVSLHVPVSVPLLKGHLGGFTVPRVLVREPVSILLLRNACSVAFQRSSEGNQSVPRVAGK